MRSMKGIFTLRLPLSHPYSSSPFCPSTPPLPPVFAPVSRLESFGAGVDDFLSTIDTIEGWISERYHFQLHSMKIAVFALLDRGHYGAAEPREDMVLCGNLGRLPRGTRASWIL